MPIQQRQQRAQVSRFCLVHGPPKLVIVDDGSEFKDMIVKTCNVLMARHHNAVKGHQKAITSEQFHQCLNEVEHTHSVNCKTVCE